MIEREVALKDLSPEISGTPAAPRRFLGEARSIGRLNHPHVVSIYEIGESNEVYFLVMELLDGGNVAELVEKNGPLPWPEACRITVEAARGLAAAHAAGMIHRDVKPANLMLTRSSVVKVVDFGLSKLLDSDHSIAEAVTRAGQILGTPQYMSPEQFDGGTVDLRTDIYALGATLFWLLTKNFPYQECTSLVQLMKAHVMKPVPLVSHRTPGLPIELDRIIGRAMAKDPQDRYTTCDEMANDLESLTEQRRRQPPSIIPTVSVQTRMLSDRQISSALVVEPSRLQAMMRRDILIQSGADTVEICSSGAEALTITETRPPDLIWTAMELPDGRGTSWLKSANVGNRLRLSTVVVNSSDCTLSELLSVSRTGCLILAPKSENLESILRVIHGSGPIRLKRGPFSSATDFAETQVRLIPDTSQPPESLLRFLSDLRIDDPDVVLPSRSGTNRGLTPDLTLLVRTAETLPGDEAIYSAMVTRRRSGLTAA
ncbi:MAG: protein kinase domain-containing protein, partial [Planctomyces sp.]